MGLAALLKNLSEVSFWNTPTHSLKPWWSPRTQTLVLTGGVVILEQAEGGTRKTGAFSSSLGLKAEVYPVVLLLCACKGAGQEEAGQLCCRRARARAYGKSKGETA